jgi:predicted  nucleic acid-binding Zn-ribbon protein
VDSDSGDEAPTLTVLESVRCLSCGAVYAKPTEGGTVRENPGCPDCGYVGWAAAAAEIPLSDTWTQRRSGADHLQHPSG